jgi:hypothetical protein
LRRTKTDFLHLVRQKAHAYCRTKSKKRVLMRRKSHFLAAPNEENLFWCA